MIYRADFKIKSSKVKLISPVIFANIAKTYFEILDEGEALSQIQKLLASNTLISDMLLFGEFPINSVYAERFKPNASDTKGKRDEYRKWKKNRKLNYFLKETENIRRRIRIDRKTGVAEEKYLFNEAEKWYNENSIYCFYVYTLDKQVLQLMELALKVMELTGIGVDTSIGVGQIEFYKENGKIFKEDRLLNELFNKESSEGYKLNLASTILFKEVIEDVEFIRYKIQRYDSRSLEIVKPPYFYTEVGNVIKVKKAKPYLQKYSNKGSNIFIYTCTFPISLDIAEKEGKW